MTVGYEVAPADYRFNIWRGTVIVVASDENDAKTQSYETDVAKRQGLGDFNPLGAYPFQLSSESQRSQFDLLLEELS